jgi:death-on-curing protein
MNSQNANGDVRYLTVSELYNINFTVTGGDTFVRDIHLLESAVKRPSLVLFGQPQFPSLADKAAALLHSLAYHHLFADGNKRTAIRAVTMFLDLNGMKPTWTDADVTQFVLEVAQHKHEVAAIAVWIGDNTKPGT